MAAAGTLANGNPSIGTVKQIQRTTDSAPSGVFIRNSKEAQAQGYVNVNAFGGLITTPLSAINGFLRSLSVTIALTGGSGAVTAAVWAADAPWSVIQNLQLRDSLGNQMINLDGYGLYLLNLLGGQVGQDGTQNPTANPSFARASGTSGVGGGNMTLRLFVPLELDSSGWCSFADMNASAPPQFQIQLNPASSVYSTAPGTLPIITVTVNQLYWLVPNNSNAQPPDLGSYAPWSYVNAGQNPPSGAAQKVQSQRVGTYIHTLIGVLRNGNNARLGAWPTSDLSLYLDNFAVRNSEFYNERQDELWRQFSVPVGYDQNSSTPLAPGGTITPIAGGFAGTSDTGASNQSPTAQVNTLGVVAYSFRSSVQKMVSSADTHDLLLSTTPATKLEVGGTWGTISAQPAQVTWITGEVVPQNPQGIPYTHLSE